MPRMLSNMRWWGVPRLCYVAGVVVQGQEGMDSSGAALTYDFTQQEEVGTHCSKEASINWDEHRYFGFESRGF